MVLHEETQLGCLAMDGEKAENGRFGDEEGNVVVCEADEHVEKTDQHEK